MSDYRLHCFGRRQFLRAALMLELTGSDWTPLWVPANQGATRSSKQWRETINAMGGRQSDPARAS